MHKQPQEDLKLSEIKYKALFDNMSSGVAVYQARNEGEDFVFVDFNRTAERVEKVKKEDLVGKSVLEVFPGIKDFGLFEVFQRVWKTGKPEHYPVAQYKDERIIVWRENHVYKLPSGEIVAVYDDATERKRSEHALRMSEQCFHAVADYSYFLETWVSPAGRPIWTNPAVLRVTGYTPRELQAMPDYPMPLVYEEDRPRVSRAFRSAMKGSRGNQFEFRLRKKDGTVIWAEMSWQPIYDEKDMSIGHRSSIRDITDRKETEDELRSAKDDWKNIFESISDVVFILDRDHRILDANRKAVAVLQQPKDKIVGRFCHELFHCTDHPPAGCPHEKLLISGQPQTADMEVEMFNGIYLVTTSPIFDQKGKIVKILHIAKDITERKRTEENIVSLAKFPDENPNPVLRISGDGTVLYNNKAASALLDISQCQDNDLVRNHLHKYVPKALKLAGSLQTEITCCNKTYSMTMMPIVESNYVTVYGLDITYIKQAERALYTSEEKFRLMFETSPLGMVLCEMDGTFVQANRAYLDIIGYSHEEAIKLSYWDVTPRDYDADEAEQIRSMKETGCYGPYEKEYIRKTGPRIPVLLNGMVVKGANGVEQIWSIVEDITNRKQAERARIRFTKELEAKNKELESILYAASHDLKSPLVNIQGFGYELSQSCELIREAIKSNDKTAQTKKAMDIALNKNIPDALNFILASTTKMDSLLSGLLDVCRLNTSSTDVKQIDMNAMMSNITVNMEYQIKESAAEIDIEALPSCVGDSSQINRVFSNLLTNALKFLDESRPGQIRIYGRKQNDQSIYCVEDNGIGIAPEHHEKIFQLFYQLEPDKRKGEGIGLTIVYRIIDKQGGKVWVESELGKGSKFFVSLPVA